MSRQDTPMVASEDRCLIRSNTESIKSEETFVVGKVIDGEGIKSRAGDRSRTKLSKASKVSSAFLECYNSNVLDDHEQE